MLDTTARDIYRTLNGHMLEETWLMTFDFLLLLILYRIYLLLMYCSLCTLYPKEMPYDSMTSLLH